MKAKELYFKTMPYVWAKLMLALVTVAISAILLGILLGIGWLFGGGVTCFMFLVWIGLVKVVNFIIMHYFGYLVKAGHIAVMVEAVTTGRVPDGQIAYGKRMVMERFATSNIYFAIDKLVGLAVKQIQRVVGKLGKALDFVPGMSTVTGLAQFFVELSLGYVDECCLGYTFYKRDQGACKSAADGVVIYAQNWKKLLGSAAKTMVMVIIGVVGITLAMSLVFGGLFWALKGPLHLPPWVGYVAFILALLIAMAVKYAFMDSFILARTMVAYMEDAPTTTISFDLYGKLCNMSAKFKELWNKGQQEESTPQPAYATAGGAPAPTEPTAATEEKPAFCGQCGAKNKRGVKFCGSCGAKM